MADMELLLVYAWWCSLCVWEKGEVFATEGHGRTRKNEKKGTVLPRNPRKNTKGKDKKLFSFRSKSLFVFFRGFRGKKSVSLFFPCSSVDSVARKRNPPAHLDKREGAVSIPGRSSDSGA